MKTAFRALVVAAVATLVTAPLGAAIFVIHLENGTTFESRYEPVDAEWDSSKLAFTDEWGNDIALKKSDIARVESDVEAAGFGTVIDNTTIALGWAPNDAPEAGTSEAEAWEAARAASAVTSVAREEPIYDSDNLPATLEYVPGLTSGEGAFVVPAGSRAPATPAPTADQPVQ